MVFQQNLLEKAFSLPKCLVWPWSGRPVLTFGKRDPKYVFKLLDPNSQTSWQQSPAPLVNDIASLRSSIYGVYLGGQRQFGASTGYHQIWNNLTPLQICRLNTCLLKKMIIGDFDRTYSSSLRIYSSYHHHHHHHHHHQSLLVLEIVPYLHGLPRSHVDL